MTEPIANSQYAGQEVAEYTAGAAANDPLRKYVYSGAYIDEPLMMVDRTALGSLPAGSEEKLYYHQNNLYSVAALTDQSGAVVERYAYTAYGEPTFLDAAGQPLANQASTVGNAYLFTGRRLDSETGLMYYRARQYSPRLGRFLSRDPVQSDINLYRYVFDNPTNLIDPEGLQAPVCIYPFCTGNPPPPPPDPRYTGGFKMCHRDIQKSGQDCCEDAAIGVLNTCFVQHCYIQYGGVNKDGTAGSGTEGWGIGGGAAGTLPSGEKAFHPDLCTSLGKGSGTLKYGKGAGKAGSKATDEEIKDCIKSVPMSKGYDKLHYNCMDWAKEAAAACGLQ